MILVDLNQVLISNLMAQTRGMIDGIPNKDMIRHMVLNSIRGYNLKFKKDYGVQILCADGADPWRRDIYPHYKHARRKGREESSTDWTKIFELISDIRREISDNLPYIVLHLDRIEADDIIATLVKITDTTKDPIMIVSGDKDFIQLQAKSNVKQYAPIQKKFIGEDVDPEQFLKEQIIRGDRSDGIPNILSADDIFLKGEKQNPVTKKRLQEWSSLKNIPLGSETSKYYLRNKRLIDLSTIPQDIEDRIINTYRTYNIPNRSKLLPYFIQFKLKALMTNINDF